MEDYISVTATNCTRYSKATLVFKWALVGFTILCSLSSRSLIGL